MRIEDEVRGAKTIGIAGHENPDGDAIGSSMGLALYLEQQMPGCRVDVFAQDVRESLKRYMPGMEQVRFDYATDVDRYDVFIELDTASDRLAGAKPYFDRAAKRINIDHHESNPGEGEVRCIHPDASSTCELVYDVIDPEKITEPVARALYIGIITDTGVFKYSNTSKHTMEVAGDLISHHLTPEPGVLINTIFYGKTYYQNQILGRALLESMLLRNGTCIVSVIDRKTMDFYQVGSKDMDGIASQLMLTDGVHCAIFMYETGPMTYKVSLRSDGSVNVAAIAQFYGGGGHERAAGMTVNASWRDIVNNISDSIDIQTEKTDRA